MTRSVRAAIAGGVLGFALGMAASALHCRPEVALVRAVECGLILAAAGWLASSLNQTPSSDDERRGARNEDAS